MVRKGVQVVATELLREPVKEAVREVIREEGVSATPGSGAAEVEATTPSESGETVRSQESDRSAAAQSSGGARSKLGLFAMLMAVVGVTYLARKRMSSTAGSAWSEPSPVASDDEGEYVSEGDMQTAGATDDGEADS